MQVPVRAPFDFQKSIRRALSRSSLSVHVDLEKRVYQRAIRIADAPVLLSVRAVDRACAPYLEVVGAEQLASGLQTELVGLVKRMFSADVDLLSFYRAFAQDAVMTKVIELGYGLRPILDTDPFEAIVRAILGQQVTVQFAATMNNRLLETFGTKVMSGDTTLHAYPTAQELTETTPNMLRELAISQRKAEYIIDFAQQVASGRIEFAALERLQDKEVLEQLTKLRGIGAWTAQCYQLFCLGRPDVVPFADVGIHRALTRAWNSGEIADAQTLRALAPAWSPWGSYVTYYLWNSLIPVAPAPL